MEDSLIIYFVTSHREIIKKSLFHDIFSQIVYIRMKVMF